MTGKEVIDKISAETGVTFLAFSAGKDSIAVWLKMRGHFEKIIPVYYYLVPGLQFVEDSLKYYEEFFQTKIYRLPHQTLYRWLHHALDSSPTQHPVLQAANIPIIKQPEILGALAKQLGIDPAWIAVGTRSADSPVRMLAFKKYGAINYKSRSYSPVWDMKKDELIDTIRESGCLLPKEYRLWGRSFDGLDHRFLHGIKKHFPDDYQRILKWFPLCEAELMRANLEKPL
jgi:hypothetical protein